MSTDHEYLNELYEQVVQPTNEDLLRMLVDVNSTLPTLQTKLSSLSQPVIAKDDINLINAQTILDDPRHVKGEIPHDSAGKIHEFVYPDGNSVPEGMKFNDLEYADATTTTKMMDGTYRRNQIGHDITSFTFPWIKMIVTYAYADGIYCCICSDNTIRVITPNYDGGNNGPFVYSYIVDEADVGYITLSPVVPGYGGEAGYPIFKIRASSTLNYMDFVAEVKVTIKKDMGIKKATFETYSATCDGAVAIAVGDGGTILHSTDNGLTWTTKSVASGLKCICQNNGTIIAAGDNKLVLRSTDNGLTWTEITDLPSFGSTIMTITCSNGIWMMTGDISGSVDSSVSIFRSEDDGLTWQDIPVYPTFTELRCIYSHDGTCIAVNYDGIYRSTDDGSSWEPTPSGSNTELNGVFHANNTWIAVGYHTTYRSTYGDTWEEIQVSGDLSSVYCFNNTWIAVGTNGAILRSTDNGLAWTKITSGVTNILWGVYYSNNTWIAVGSGGTILRSTDDGLTWTKVTVSGVSSTLWGITQCNVPSPFPNLYEKGENIQWDTMYLKRSMTSSVWPYHLTLINKSRMTMHHVSQDMTKAILDTGTINHIVIDDTNYRCIYSNGNKTFACGSGIWDISNDASICVLESFGLIYNIHYANNTWIAVGSEGSILRSIDNGLIWARITVSGVNNNLYSIYYANNTWIIVGYSGIILRSTDNGLNWTKITVSGVTSALQSIYYANNTWIIVGYTGIILRSTDDGLTWTKITVDGVSNNLNSIYYANNVWIAVGNSNIILRSTDDGLTWTSITISGVTSYLYSIYYSNRTWIIVGTGTTILRSTDNGLTWTKITVDGVSGNLNSIYYANNVWIAVGDYNIILRSTDDGLTWTSITISGVTSQLQDIHYANHTWIIVGYSGIILRSTDDGLTWTEITSGVSNNLFGIYYANNTWIIVGSSGIILRSTDNGLNWTKISVSGISGYLYSIHYANNTWIIVGNITIILRSTDNGLTWTKISVSNNLNSIYYANNVWIAVGNSNILRSTDNGLTWTKITVSGVSNELRCIHYANNTWIIVGSSGIILRSTDDGLTWTKNTNSVGDRSESIHYANHIWMIVGSRGIVRSADDGLTWGTINGINNRLNSIYYANHTWIAAGMIGTIIRSTDDFYIWLFYRYKYLYFPLTRGGLNIEDLQCLSLSNISETSFSKNDYNNTIIRDTVETKNSFTSAVESIYNYGDSLKPINSNYTIIDKMVNSVIHRYEESKNTAVVSNYDYLDGFDKVLGTYFIMGNPRESGAQPELYEDDTAYGRRLKYSKIVVRSVTITDLNTQYSIRQYSTDALPAGMALVPRAVILEIRGENGVTGLFTTSRPTGDVWGYLSNHPERLYLALSYSDTDIIIDTTFGTESGASTPLVKGQYIFYLIY